MGPHSTNPSDTTHTRLPTPPHGTERYRGANHVLVSRRTSLAVLRSRIKKLLSSRKWHEVHIHGLGAALAPAIAVAAGIVCDAPAGGIVASASTSTELLIEHADMDVGEADRSSIRHNSAVHICLRKQDT